LPGKENKRLNPTFAEILEILDCRLKNDYVSNKIEDFFVKSKKKEK